MRFKRSDSHGSPPFLSLAEAIINYARSPQQLLDIAHAVWPRLSVYQGHTHWRFMTTSSSANESFVVDFYEEMVMVA